jgi:D-arabinose 1-dehydrogenase-like Zn-dependent alcohol dehydrogenase
MMMKGPFREFIPVDEEVVIRIPDGAKIKDIRLLVSGQKTDFKNIEGKITLKVKQIKDYEIIGIDLS